MKLIFSGIILLGLAGSAFVAQKPTSDSDGNIYGQPVRVSRPASENRCYASSSIYVKGDGIRPAENVHEISVHFFYSNENGRRCIEPKYLYLMIYTNRANDQLIYRDEHIVTIVADGVVLLSANPKLKDDWNSYGWSRKMFSSFPISYSQFTKILDAKTVTFQIGPTKETLKPESIQILRDMNNSIESESEVPTEH